jgi:hypothetical protein
VDDLERIELSAVLDFFAAAPPDVLRAFDLAVLDLGDAAAFSIGAHPKMLLGLDASAGDYGLCGREHRPRCREREQRSDLLLELLHLLLQPSESLDERVVRHRTPSRQIPSQL